MKQLSLCLFLLFFPLLAIAQPINDTCGNSITITVPTGGSTQYAADLTTATETQEGSCLVTGDDNLDLWYDFVMPVTGNVRVTDIGSFENVTIFDSCGGTELACFFNDGFVYGLISGISYKMRFGIRSNFTLNQTFNIEAFEALSNDECASSELITVTTTGITQVNLDYRAATESIDGSCETPANTNHDAWYTFVMPEDGNIRVTSLGSFETVTLFDSCGGTEITCFYDDGFIYNLTKNQTYTMRMGLFSNFTTDSSFDIQAFEALPNDDCVDRETLTITTANYLETSVDIRRATESIDASCETPGNTNLDAWYEFEMPVDGNVRVTGIGGFTNIAVYDSCGGTEIACFFDDNFVYNLTENTTYVLRVGLVAGFAGVINFRLQAFETLPNDECVSSEEITVTTVNYTETALDIRRATESIDSSCESSGNLNLDAWYNFDMPVDGNVRVTNIGGFTNITLFDTCGGTEISCFYDDGFFYDLSEGQNYTMRVGLVQGFADEMNFRLQAFEAIGNDQCVDKETLLVETANYIETSLEIRGATESIDSSCETAGNTNLDGWYEFEMPVNGSVRVTNIGGFTSASLYDSCGGAEIACFYNDGFFYNLTEGATYIVRIGLREGFADTVNFRIQAFEQIPNDECADATVINVPTVDYSEITVELRGATESIDSSCETAGNTNHDAWYQFVMPVDGTVQITNVGGFDNISLFDSCGGTEISCDYDDTTLFNLAAGTTYTLRMAIVSGFSDLSNFRIQAFAAPLAACVATVEFVGGVWLPNAPDITTNVILRNNYDTTTPGLGSFSACSVSLDNNVTLTIGAGDYVEVGYDVNVPPTATLDILHEGSIVQRDGSSVTTNNGTVRVRKTTPFLRPRDLMLMGSPMDLETRNGVYNNAFLVLNHTTSNFVPNPAVAAMFPLAENFMDDNKDNWTRYDLGPINVGEGYIVRPQSGYLDGNTTYDLIYDEGTLNNGDIPFNVIFNNDKNDSPNFLGNPYPSAINADDFIRTNSMIDEVYFWEHLTRPSNSLPGPYPKNFNMEDFSMYNLAGGIAAASDLTGDTQPDGNIASAQGFAIKANAAGTAMFTNEMRRLTNNDTWRASSEEKNRLWLQVANQEFEFQGTTLVAFLDNATAALDQGYDSRRIATVVSLYSQLETGEELGIQSRETFDASIKIPIGFSSLVKATTDYTISIKEIEGADLLASEVFLFDSVKNVITNLSSENYTFTAFADDYKSRFTVFFSQEVLGVAGFSSEDITLLPNPARDQVVLANPKGLSLEQAVFYDISGRVVKQIALTGMGSAKTIDISDLGSAMYLVQLSGVDISISTRLIKE